MDVAIYIVDRPEMVDLTRFYGTGVIHLQWLLEILTRHAQWLVLHAAPNWLVAYVEINADKIHNEGVAFIQDGAVIL